MSSSEEIVEELVSLVEEVGLTQVDECEVEYYLWFEDRDTAKHAITLVQQQGVETTVERDDNGNWGVSVRVRTVAMSENFSVWQRRINDVAQRSGGEYVGLVLHPHLQR